MVSFSKRKMQEDAARAAAKKAHGAGFMPKPLSARTNPQTTRQACPQCNKGRTFVPKSMRTTKVNASDGSCGWCGGDGYLDPGDRGYRR